MSARGGTRVLAGCALAGVSLIAAVVSYLHALAVVREVGARPPVAYLIPCLADLVILGASAALLDAARRRASLSRLAIVSLLAGIGVTLAMNVAAGLAHGPAGALVAGWPAVAFILALESLAGMVRRGRGVSGEWGVPAAPGQDEPAEPPPVEDALRAVVAAYSQRSVAGALKVPRSRIAPFAPRAASPVTALNGRGPDAG